MLDGSALLNRLLASLLNDVRGTLTPNAPLAEQTWFRVGGPAEILFKPADADDLANFLATCPADIPVTILGAASNTLVRDGGVPGVVVRMGPSFGRIEIIESPSRSREGLGEGSSTLNSPPLIPPASGGDRFLVAGAAAIDLNVARAAAAAGIAGLEFLSGIPGTIGGGLRMNAGAYGREFKDIVIAADAITRQGKRITLTPAEIGFSYRHTAAPADLIYSGATLRGTAGDPATIQAAMQQIQKSRADSQPIREKTGGSTFANPEGHKSWQLIDAAGCRGLRVGGAMMSEKHANFLINTGNATAEDIENLGEEVRRRVKEHSGIELRWEIKRIGVKKENQP